MAVDIGTGVIQIEINRAQLRREATQASRVLARTPTRFVPQIDARRLQQQLQVALRGLGPEVWRPLQAGGVQAMQAVGASGVAAMNAVEVRGLAAAARLRTAFAAATAGGALAPQPRAQAPLAAPRGGAQQAAQQGVTTARLFTTNFAAETISGAGDAGNAAGKAIGGGLEAGLIAAGVATAAALTRRFQRLGGIERFGGGAGFNRATLGTLLETIGFREAGQRQREDFDARQIAGVRVLTDEAGDAAGALARLAREAEKSSTAEQRSRGAAARRAAAADRAAIASDPGLRPGSGGDAAQSSAIRQARRQLDLRNEEVRDLRQRLRARERVSSGREAGFFESNFGFGGSIDRIFNDALAGDLQYGLDRARERQREARRDLRDARGGNLVQRAYRRLASAISSRAAAYRYRRGVGIEDDADAPTGRDLERQRRQIRILNEQRIDEITNQTAQQRVQSDLLRRGTARDEILRSSQYNQGRRYQEALRDQAFESRRNAILQRRQTDSLRVSSRLVFGRSGLGATERLGVVMEGLGNALQRWGTAVGIAAIATYVIVRAIRASAERFEQLQAAQIAAGSIAQRTLGAGGGGAAVDIGAVTEGIRAGAAGGLSELTIARTAIDAIRTGSEDIFLNTETVLRDLRVVAAATGVAFEDATTRFFRGIIKREQELLDELGIVARVEAANARYARSINVATSQLTPFQQQLAFAEEVQRQLTISAQNFGTEQVLATQRATEASNRLGAVWSNLFADLGAQTRGLSEVFSAVGIGVAAAVRFNLGIRRAQAAEVVEVTNLNRLEAERNRLISERLGLISQSALQGNLDINQQRSLLQLTQELPAQQAQIFGPGGVGPAAPQFSAGNIAQASANVTELNGAIRNLADARSRTRIASLQGPLAALLTSLEGGGRVAALSAEAYQDLTRGTAESEEAIRLLATVFNRSVPEVRALIEANRQLEVVRQREAETTRDILRLANEALRFGPALRENLDALGQGLTAGVQTFRDLIPATTELAAPTLDAAGIRERAPIARTPLEIDLTARDRFSLVAGEIGLTLETMTSNFSRFSEDLLFESNSIREALSAFIRNIAQTVVRSQATSLGNEIFGQLGFTNVGGTGGGASNYNITNIGIANPLQAREASFQAAALGGIGI